MPPIDFYAHESVNQWFLKSSKNYLRINGTLVEWKKVQVQYLHRYKKQLYNLEFIEINH